MNAVAGEREFAAMRRRASRINDVFVRWRRDRC